MKILPLSSRNFGKVLEETAKALREGKVVVYPTDTCYGLGALVSCPSAIEKIREFKGREEERPFSVIVPNLAWVYERMERLNEERKEFIEERLPGPYTFVVKIKEEFAKELAPVLSNQKLGFRYPDHKFCQKLAGLLGEPFITTSANLSGEPPAYSYEEFARYLKERKRELWPDLFIDAGKLAKRPPSKVLDISVYPFKVLRS